MEKTAATAVVRFMRFPWAWMDAGLACELRAILAPGGANSSGYRTAKFLEPQFRRRAATRASVHAGRRRGRRAGGRRRNVVRCGRRARAGRRRWRRGIPGHRPRIVAVAGAVVVAGNRNLVAAGIHALLVAGVV